MKLKCKEGDMAVVIHDTPKCIDNIGRIVQIRGPVRMNAKLKRRCWSIRPLDSTQYAVEDHQGRLTREVVDWDSLVEHPDAWLHPISPGEGIDEAAGVRRLAQSNPGSTSHFIDDSTLEKLAVTEPA
jgi:hypothetical protein